MKYASLVLVTCLCMPASSNAQQLTGAQYYRLRQQADSLFRAANLAGSEAILRQLLNAHDTDPEVWLQYARALQTNNKNEEALTAYQRVLALGFGYPADHYFAIARIFAQLGQRDSTIAYLDHALRARYAQRERLRTESVFEPYRSDPRFRKLAAIPPEGLSRSAQWQFDLDYLVEEARRLHASFDRLAFAPAFDSAAAVLRRDIPRLADEGIIARMRALVVHLDDGHTGVYFESPARLPITLYWFKDGVFVLRDLRAATEPLPNDTSLAGSRVLAIEGVPVEQALQRVAAFITRDNDMGVRAIGPAYLGNRPILRASGLLRDSSALKLTVRNRKGVTRELSIGFVKPTELSGRLNILPGDSTKRPLWLQHVNTAYWMRNLPEARAVYLQFNAVRNDPANPLAQFAKQLTQQLESSRAQNLIVDLRHNGGGNSYLFPPLVRSMIVFKEKSPQHTVYVIIGRNTFSAAQNFATAIDQWVGAVFVGEPSGSRANFVGESSPFRLPATGTRANISWRWHQYAQWVDQRKFIAPHIPVEPTSNDFVSGRDAALEAILEVIQGR